MLKKYNKHKFFLFFFKALIIFVLPLIIYRNAYGIEIWPDKFIIISIFFFKILFTFLKLVISKFFPY